MKSFTVNSIGTIKNENGETSIVLDKKYIPALTGIEGFGYLSVFWWFNENDNEQSRNKLTEESPYEGSPDILGTFATRSPERPNPIALTTCYVKHIDFEQGIIHLDYIDANDGSSVLDIKPYTPSFDRVESPIVPSWCENWPKSLEESGDFDWGPVFRF